MLLDHARMSGFAGRCEEEENASTSKTIRSKTESTVRFASFAACSSSGVSTGAASTAVVDSSVDTGPTAAPAAAVAKGAPSSTTPAAVVAAAFYAFW
jgi:hypothetical protein